MASRFVFIALICVTFCIGFWLFSIMHHKSRFVWERNKLFKFDRKLWAIYIEEKNLIFESHTYKNCYLEIFYSDGSYEQQYLEDINHPKHYFDHNKIACISLYHVYKGRHSLDLGHVHVIDQKLNARTLKINGVLYLELMSAHNILQNGIEVKKQNKIDIKGNFSEAEYIKINQKRMNFIGFMDWKQYEFTVILGYNDIIEAIFTRCITNSLAHHYNFTRHVESRQNLFQNQIFQNQTLQPEPPKVTDDEPRIDVSGKAILVFQDGSFAEQNHGNYEANPNMVAVFFEQDGNLSSTLFEDNVVHLADNPCMGITRAISINSTLRIYLDDTFSAFNPDSTIKYLNFGNQLHKTIYLTGGSSAWQSTFSCMQNDQDTMVKISAAIVHNVLQVTCALEAASQTAFGTISFDPISRSIDIVNGDNLDKCTVRVLFNDGSSLERRANRAHDIGLLFKNKLISGVFLINDSQIYTIFQGDVNSKIIQNPDRDCFVIGNEAYLSGVELALEHASNKWDHHFITTKTTLIKLSVNSIQSFTSQVPYYKIKWNNYPESTLILSGNIKGEQHRIEINSEKYVQSLV